MCWFWHAESVDLLCMPLDHYVSQVHLKQFARPPDSEQLRGYNKRTNATFPCHPEDVCRTQDGSTNQYLEEERVVEEFLKGIEPQYNVALDAIRKDQINVDAVYVMAGFAAYVATCSPGAMRSNSAPLKAVVEATGKRLDAQGEIHPAPDSLGGKSISELIEDGSVQVKIDQKYPQAIGIAQIKGRLSAFGNAQWDVLINEHDESPFFTSDFPVPLEPSDDPRIMNRIVPLAPDVAIRIRPQLDARDTLDLSFPCFSYRRQRLRRNEIRPLNRLIVRGAEQLVFYGDEKDWMLRFIERNRHFRVECNVQQFDAGDGTLMHFGQRIEAYEGWKT